MSATLTVTVSVTRTPDPGDVKGPSTPRSYTLVLPGVIDEEIIIPIVAGAVDQVVTLPQPGAVQALFFMYSDIPISWKRNVEGIAQALGAKAIVLAAGAPNAQPNVTQILVSNPGLATAHLYILTAGV